MPKIKITDYFLDSLEFQYLKQQGYLFTNEIKSESSGYTIFDISGPNLTEFDDSEYINICVITHNDYGFVRDIKIIKA